MKSYRVALVLTPLFVFILLFSYIIILSSRTTNIEKYGVYRTTISPCTDQGLKVITHTCTPNKGRGCLNEGRESFAPVVETVSCSTTRPASIWNETISPCETEDVCVTSTSVGTAIKRLECVSLDSPTPGSLNECILHELSPDTLTYETNTYSPGDIKEVSIPCTPEGPQCGTLISVCSDHILDDPLCPVDYRFDQSTILVPIPCTIGGVEVDHSLCQTDLSESFCEKTCVREDAIVTSDPLTTNYCIIEKTGKGVLGIRKSPDNLNNSNQLLDIAASYYDCKYLRRSDFVCQFGVKGNRYRIRVIVGVSFVGFLRHRKGKQWWQQERTYDINSGGIKGNNAQTFGVNITNSDMTCGSFLGYRTAGRIFAKITPGVGEVVIHLLLDEKALSDRS